MQAKVRFDMRFRCWLFPFQDDLLLSAATRQRATVFSAISFALLCLLIFQNILSLKFIPIKSPQIIYSFVSVGFVFISLLLNRTGRHNVATLLLISTLSFFVIQAAFRQDTPNDLISTLYWLTVVIVIAGLIASTRTVVIILTILLGFISFLAIRDPSLYEIGLYRVIGLLSTCGVAVAVYARILTDKVNEEADRSAELAQLNNVLEERVQQRTIALEEANIQLQEEMAQRAKTEVALRQTGRLESLGLMAGRIAHDFNNWLSAITIHNAIAQTKISEDHSAHTNIKTVGQVAQEASELTQQLLAYASKRPQKPEHFALDEALKKWTFLMERTIPKQILFETNIGDDLLVFADKKQIQQVVINLIINASHAVSKDGKISLSSNTYTLSNTEGCFVGEKPRAGKYVTLIVQDNGCGMDEQTKERIFDPFFTTKPPEQGTGLGLSSVLGIVRSCHGFIEVCSTPNVGTTFTLYFPTTCENEAYDELKKDSAEIPSMPRSAPQKSHTAHSQ